MGLGHLLTADLRAPLNDDAGRPNWRYQLFRAALPGDTVFHYDTNAAAITGVSRIAGSAFDCTIVWGAKGSYARLKGTNNPRERPGYVVPLANFRSLHSPVTLQDIRYHARNLTELTSALNTNGANTLYFPFELSSKREPRLLQGYAFKLPKSFVDLFAGLKNAAAEENLHDVDFDSLLVENAHVKKSSKAARAYDDDASGEEGEKRVRAHFVRERDMTLVTKKKDQMLRRVGKIACEVCGFDFSQGYGALGEGLIDCHHVVPLSSRTDTCTTQLDDLVLLCANCHRVVHHRKAWLTMDQLRAAVAGRANQMMQLKTLDLD